MDKETRINLIKENLSVIKYAHKRITNGSKPYENYERLAIEGKSRNSELEFLRYKLELLDLAIKASVKLKRLCKNSNLEDEANEIYNILLSIVAASDELKNLKFKYDSGLNRSQKLNEMLNLLENMKYKRNPSLFDIFSGKD